MRVLDIEFADASNGFTNPQVEHMGDGYDWDAPESVLNVGTPAAGGRAPNLRSFHLAATTGFTDFVTQGYIPTPGLLVSARLDALLARHDLPPHRRWPADVALGAEHRPYFWLAFGDGVEQRIDWPASRFVVRRDGGHEEAVVFESGAAMAETARRLVDTLEGRLWPAVVVFRPGESPPDLFELGLDGSCYLVSERLAEALVRASVTGFRLQPLAGG